MKTFEFISIVICITLLFAQCSKDVNKSSYSTEPRISIPAVILGKWNLVNEEDTSFYSEHLMASSWCFKNWFYNFSKNGFLEIGNGEFTDSFTYYFSDKACINITWIGSPINTCTDTIINLTDTACAFMHWENNADNSKTKRVFHLSKKI